MSWEDFWTGANSTFEQGANIGADVYLKKLAAKIQQRHQDKQNLWDSIQADNKRKADMSDWELKQQRMNEDQAKEADLKRAMDKEAEDYKTEQEVQQAADAVDFRISRLGKDGESLKGYPRTAAGIKAVEAELARMEKDSEYKRKRADEIADRDYKAKGADGATDVRKPEQARIMAEGIVKKEVGTLPKEIDALTEASVYDKTIAPELQSKQSELNAIEANRPGGIPALTDSLRLGQGQYATPEQMNQPVSPEQAASVTQELATLKQQLAELLKSLGAKQ